MRLGIILCLLSFFYLVGCTQVIKSDQPVQVTEAVVAASSESMIEIKEKMFITQINDIYVNSEGYLGQTIKYEGIFNEFYWPEANQTYYSVIRYGPGCCGADQNAGFEISWKGDYPKQNDWVEVVGVLEEYDENGTTFLQLNVQSLAVLDVRGVETVNQ